MLIGEPDKTPPRISIDLELTNACNASCTFCPRDNMPAIGKLKPDNFYRAVERGLEYSVSPIFRFCGTGDALLNKNIVEYAQHIFQSGCELRISTNGHLLTEEKSQALIEAGVAQMTFSISSRGDRYRQEYGLDYETTHENILRFIELAKGKCKVRVAMVLHDETIPYAEDEAYWRSIGVDLFKKYNLINRAGALFPVKELLANEINIAKKVIQKSGGCSVCLAPFLIVFVGWDGRYYLCSSDWRKQASVGHVATHTIKDTISARRSAVETRNPICHQCTHDPVNKLLIEPIKWSSETKLPLRQIS